MHATPFAAFIAHDLASWLGVPAGVVIAAMVVLRKYGTQLRARRQASRQQTASPPAPSAGLESRRAPRP